MSSSDDKATVVVSFTTIPGEINILARQGALGHVMTRFINSDQELLDAFVDSIVALRKTQSAPPEVSEESPKPEIVPPKKAAEDTPSKKKVAKKKATDEQPSMFDEINPDTTTDDNNDGDGDDEQSDD